MKKWIILLTLVFFTLPALAQWQVPVNSIPVGRGAGVQGFGSITGTNGTCLIISGGVPTFGSCVSVPFTQPTSYPPTVSSGHIVPYLNSDAQFGNIWSQYPLGSVSTNPIIIGKAGSSVGSNTLGQTFKIVFTSAGLTGSPITVTYTAIGGDTVGTIATGLCALVNANTTLHSSIGGKPIFCQALSGGIFNLQYDAAYGSTGATPLTTATTGSTGTITLAAEQLPLDFIIFQLGRNTAPRPGLIGDAIYAFDWTAPDSTGTFNTHFAIFGCSIKIATSGATRGLCDLSTADNNGSAIGRFSVGEGVMIRGTSGALPTGGDLGVGTLNLPSVGKISIDNIANFRRNSGSAQTILEGTGSDNILISGNAGVGINTTPTGTTFTSALGAFISGTQIPTTGSGWSLQGGSTPVLAAKNYDTSAWLAATEQALSFDFQPSGSATSGIAILANLIQPAADNVTALGGTAHRFTNGFFSSHLYLGPASLAVPSNSLQVISHNTAALPNPTTNNVFLQYGAADGVTGAMQLYGFTNGASVIQFFGSSGAGSAPAAPTIGTTVGILGFGGYDGTSAWAGNKSRIYGIVSETWSTTAQGIALCVDTTAAVTTTRTQAACFRPSGGFYVGSSTTDPGTGVVYGTNGLQNLAVAVASLPTCNAAAKSLRHFVTDANATFTAGIGAVVAAGGANNVPVTCDGLNWRIG